MKREMCAACKRAVKACICAFIETIDNHVMVVILQHCSEVNHTKGTASLLTGSLNNQLLIVGEDFTNNITLNQLIAKYGETCYLLYPEDAITLPFAKKNEPNDSCQQFPQPQCILLLDGTWKKAYRMYQRSKNLHALAKLTLPKSISGQYTIRKTNKAHALSTLEATCYALALIEGNEEKYKIMLDNFIAFNHFQMAFRPTSHGSESVKQS